MDNSSNNSSIKVLFSQRIPKTDKPTLRKEIKVKYYEFIYIVNNNEIQYLNENIKIMQKGDIIIRKPGDTASSNTIGMNYRIGLKTKDQYLIHLIKTIPSFFTPENPKEILNNFINLSNIEKNKNLDFLNQRINILSILYKLHNDYHNLNKDSYLDKCISFMKENYQKKISVQNIADHLHISKSYLHKVFRERYSQTPIEYLTHIRMEHAIKLMSQNNMSITEIAKKCGIDSYAYFYKLFTDIYKLPPGKFSEEVFY